MECYIKSSKKERGQGGGGGGGGFVWGRGDKSPGKG